MNVMNAFNAAPRAIGSEARRQRRPAPLFFRARASAIVVAAMACVLPSPVNAAANPSARLVRCADESCLLVTGHRENAAAAVAINGHVVPVEGQRKWRVALPVETVRSWSAPRARTIEVSLHDPESERGSSAEVRLPIGLLGGVTDLANLVVSVR